MRQHEGGAHLIVGIVAIIVLSAVGFTGYRIISQRSDTATKNNESSETASQTTVQSTEDVAKVQSELEALDSGETELTELETELEF